jgi:hypothetical protein
MFPLRLFFAIKHAFIDLESYPDTEALEIGNSEQQSVHIQKYFYL